MFSLHDLPEIRRLAEIAAGVPGIPTAGEPALLALQSVVLGSLVGAYQAERYEYLDDLFEEARVFLTRCTAWSLEHMEQAERDGLLEYISKKTAERREPDTVVTGGTLTDDELAELLGDLDDHQAAK